MSETPLFEFEHMALAARDTSTLKDWYVDVLGAEVVFQMVQTPPAFLVKLAGVLLEIYNANSSSDLVRDNGLAGWRHIALKFKVSPTANATTLPSAAPTSPKYFAPTMLHITEIPRQYAFVFIAKLPMFKLGNA